LTIQQTGRAGIRQLLGQDGNFLQGKLAFLFRDNITVKSTKSHPAKDVPSGAGYCITDHQLSSRS
jgi:hypothetical protein